jgi:hypothetical protein
VCTESSKPSASDYVHNFAASEVVSSLFSWCARSAQASIRPMPGLTANLNFIPELPCITYKAMIEHPLYLSGSQNAW